ncbi:hypothetical protein AB3N04_04665 [Alkalihalophilus sp. As8PL]|uniref:Uncharacterized protein n=1 Tax=Alkalihalophilus sp. As8PL TaxID=3237103 RepID=A0AB39BW19_9BACI
MNRVLKCTTEELMLLVNLCGYPDVAKGIGESSLGEKSEDAWEAVYEGAVHQLMLKEVWDVQKAAENEVPLNEELQTFIHHYVQSQSIIRSANVTTNETLLFHEMPNDKWLMHHVIADLIHEFFFVEESEIEKHIIPFSRYNQVEGEALSSFTLTDHQFDLLSKEENILEVRGLAKLTKEEEMAFDSFVHSIKVNEWSLHNSSLLRVDAETGESSIEEILFHVPSEYGIWMLSYDEELVVHVKNVSANEFMSTVRSRLLIKQEA